MRIQIGSNKGGKITEIDVHASRWHDDRQNVLRHIAETIDAVHLAEEEEEKNYRMGGPAKGKLPA